MFNYNPFKKCNATVFIIVSFFVSTIILYTLYKILKNKESEYFEIKKTKKIAFCFLIYEEIYHEDIWYNYLKDVDKNKYNIYIHYKEDKPLKHFDKYKLKTTIPTCWGCLSLVQAQNLILNEALTDDDNQHFIWLSDSCIPLKKFDTVYNFLDSEKSYFNIAPDEQVFPRANNALKYIKKENIKKASMASIINRKHAQLFVNNTKNINLWFKDINVPDEIVYITLLHHYNLENELVLTPNIAAGAIIFAQWSDMKNYKTFKNSKKIKVTPYTYEYICPEELNYLIKSKSLFARKFIKGCKGLENLLHILV